MKFYLASQIVYQKESRKWEFTSLATSCSQFEIAIIPAYERGSQPAGQTDRQTDSQHLLATNLHRPASSRSLAIMGPLPVRESALVAGSRLSLRFLCLFDDLRAFEGLTFDEKKNVTR